MSNTDCCISTALKEELKSSMGCTEPAAIAFATAYSKEQLPEESIKKIDVGLSSNMLKNALCVTIPNTKMSGIETIVLLGLIKDDCENKFKILSNITKEDLDKVQKLKKNVKVNIKLVENVDPLYIEIKLKSKNHDVRTIIEEQHDIVKECYLDDKLIYSNTRKKNIDKYDGKFDFDDILNYVSNKKYDKELIEKVKKYNSEIGEYGLKNDVGLNVGTGISKIDLYRSEYSSIIAKTVSGIDSRMSGASKTVIINSGSGNQGITATVPIVEFAKNNNISEEVELSALALSHLVALYIRSKQSRLSSACGAISASAGVAAGISYMLGCNNKQIKSAVSSFLCSNFGVFCDGAKATCALKVSSAVSSAINCALLAKNGLLLEDSYGIVSPSFENTINNIAKIEKKLTLSMDKTIMKVAIDNAKNKGGSKC